MDNGYRLELQEGCNCDGARQENVAHIFYDKGRNHYVALRKPPTDWTLRTKTDRVAGGPAPGAAAGQLKAQRAACPLQPDVERSAKQGRDGGSETERKEAPKSTGTGKPKIALRNCKLFGEAKGRRHLTTRQWEWRGAAPTRNQCRDATPAQPARTRACAGCGVEKTQGPYSATQ